MKVATKISWVIALSMFYTSILAQDPCYTRTKPLTYYAFQRMMRQHYNFTILGTQTPVSGFKVETNKPTLTLKGNIYTSGKNESINKKALIINLELTGGVSNDIQQILSGKQLNGYFKGTLGFNVLFDGGNNAKYTLGNDFEKMLIRKNTCMYREEVQTQLDTLLVLLGLEHILNAPNKSLDATVAHIVVLAGQDGYTLKSYSRPAVWNRPFSYANISAHYKKLLLEMVKKYGGDASMTDNNMFDDFITKLGNRHNNTLRASKMAADYKRSEKFKKEEIHKYKLIDEYEIESYKEIWTRKIISWLNISITGSNSSFKLYDAPQNFLLDSNSFLPGVNASYNYFQKYKSANKYLYFRFGLGVKRVNSLTDLVTFDYKKETVVNISPTETLKTEKAGTAYQGTLSHGVGIDIPVELYWAPWEHEAIPGLYGKVQYSYGEPWINKNKVSLDVGIIWNVNNSEKDSKNVLTIVPYMNWRNLVKEYRDEPKTIRRKTSELFSIGLKFGIPVNLGK